MIVQVNLSDYSVTTIAGTGFQGNDKEGGKLGKKQAISSPWDLALGKTPGVCLQTLYIYYIIYYDMTLVLIFEEP